MATEFKYLRFGLVPSDFTNSDLENGELVIRSFLKTFNDYQLMTDVAAHSEIFLITRRFVGANFRNWLMVNFRHGGGARKELVRKIAGYINGTLPGSVVINQLKIDINGLRGATSRGEPIRTPIIYNQFNEGRDHFKVENVDFSKIEDRNLYDFLALIGPELAAKFCLSLDGIYYE